MPELSADICSLGVVVAILLLAHKEAARRVRTASLSGASTHTRHSAGAACTPDTAFVCPWQDYEARRAAWVLEHRAFRYKQPLEKTARSRRSSRECLEVPAAG